MAYTGQRQKLNTTAFGEIAVAEETPQIQLQFPFGINPNLVSTTVVNVGTVTSNPPFCVVQTGAAATSSASFRSVDCLHYKPGEGSSLLFTAVFNSGVSGSQQYVGLGDQYNGFFFGWNGSTFGILYRQQVYGVTVTTSTITDNWIYQNDWNVDSFNGNGGSGVILNPTLGNVYKIQMQWLGFGTINFYIENNVNGNFTLVHQINNANSFTNTSISNPTLPVSAMALNTSNTSNIVVKVPSIGAFVEGQIYQNNMRYSVFGSNNGFVSDNLVLSLRNVYTYNNIINKKSFSPDFVSLWNLQSNQPVLYRFVLNPVLSTSSYVFLSTNNSVVQYYSPGSVSVSLSRQLNTRTLFHIYSGINQQVNLSLSSFNVVLNPGDVFAVSATTIGTAASVNCALSWTEQF